jgi:hypothetical protein
MNKFTKFFVATVAILMIICTVAQADPPSASNRPGTPFAKQVNLVSDSSNSMGTGTITVPVHQRLVIELFSGTASVANGVEVVGFSISLYTNNVLATHWFVVTPQGTYDVFKQFTTCQPVKLYADPGQDIKIIYITSDASGIGAGNQGWATVSGYLENAR